MLDKSKTWADVKPGGYLGPPGAISDHLSATFVKPKAES